MGMATVEVCVCGSAGRDKTKLENKLTPSTTTTKDDSDSEGKLGACDEEYADMLGACKGCTDYCHPNSLLL